MIFKTIFSTLSHRVSTKATTKFQIQNKQQTTNDNTKMSIVPPLVAQLQNTTIPLLNMPQAILLRLLFIAILLAALPVEGWVSNDGNSIRMSRTSTPSSKIQLVSSSSSSRSSNRGRASLSSLQAAKDDKKGYKFGDFTKGIGRKVTGDDDYKVHSLRYMKLRGYCIK